MAIERPGCNLISDQNHSVHDEHSANKMLSSTECPFQLHSPASWKKKIVANGENAGDHNVCLPFQDKIS